MTDAAAGTADDGIGIAALAPLSGAAIAAVAVALLFLDTSVSIVTIWNRSETFTHGFFVLPIFLWLVWRERAAIAGLVAVPEPRMLPPIAGAGALWLVSRVADVLAGQQLALVLMIVFVIVAFAGREIARTIRFPLLFLLFLAPLGEELVPLLMDITAELTVGAIALTGIPIYREGLFFSLPSGDWSVVEACSGIRYLIASIVLGSLYAHLYIEGTSRKLAFLALSAIVPIAANGIRAFLIVMLGHFSGMKLATGADHLVYGWLFFGIVMFLLFSVGALFRRDETDRDGEVDANGGTASDSERTGPGTTVVASADVERRPVRSPFGRSVVTHAMLVALSVALWPLWASTVDARAAGVTLSGDELVRTLPLEPATSDAADTRVTDWRPLIAGHDELRRSVIDGEPDRPSVLALAHVYVTQRQGKEMIASGNVLVPSRDSPWRRLERGSVTAPAAGDVAAMPIAQSRLESSDGSLLAWRWYRVGDAHTGSASRAKLLETRDRLLLRAAPSVAYVLAADATDRGAAKAALAAAYARVVAPGEPPARLADNSETGSAGPAR